MDKQEVEKHTQWNIINIYYHKIQINQYQLLIWMDKELFINL